MKTELVTFKMDFDLLKEVDKTSSAAGFHSRTEFIREALREKIEEIKLKQAMIKLANLRGRSARRTSDEKLHQIREKVFEDLARKFR